MGRHYVEQLLERGAAKVYATARRIALDGIEAGLIEIVADDWSTHVKASLSADPALFYPQAVPAT